ncbi:hypothetical protein RA280_43690 [Cupriavidus sp. CV2]|uniref:hypothetical protein n=1 Tax=Cupriavidus ulmosensis TaxID=3065913 RepID=UPI00296AC19C|nr:hypothetical protein [Cupriavidus sp. CV2]MDW3688512.1 hypothetical protein [Cupriavidus sp. CV2]
MPALLEHIDAIARKLKRDVLYVAFPQENRSGASDYKSLNSRKRILEWLEHEQVPCRECGPYASETTMRSYAGEVFIDVPFDEADPLYQKVQAFLERPDGTMRFDGVKFYIVTLEFAMKNAHHDEPGFWEKCADNF